MAKKPINLDSREEAQRVTRNTRLPRGGKTLMPKKPIKLDYNPTKNPIKLDPKEVRKPSTASPAEQRIHDRSLARTEGITRYNGKAGSANMTPNNARHSLNKGLRRDRADILRLRRRELADKVAKTASNKAARAAAGKVAGRIVAGALGGVVGAVLTVGQVAESMYSSKRKSDNTVRARRAAGSRHGGVAPRG